MPSNEEQIRTLVEEWAAAVHRGDMNGVLADHADDVVMFDVPPPYEGVRGLDAYRATWPGFFEWQAQGAVVRARLPGHHGGRRRRVRPRAAAVWDPAGARRAT